jgi:hypothetical protein
MDLRVDSDGMRKIPHPQLEIIESDFGLVYGTCSWIKVDLRIP